MKIEEVCIYIRVSGNEWVVSLNERVHSTINTDDTFPVHVPALITAESVLYITPQITTNAPDILHLNNYSYGHA